jgi:hypothetical protein
MSQEIVRCPYCVEGSDFRPMFRQSEESFVCSGCGHESTPEGRYGRCICQRCIRMNRVASRISREHPELSPAANS